MPAILRPVLLLSAAAFLFAACDELEGYDKDPYVRAENVANLRCARAVGEHTGVAGATPNTTIAVFEANQYLINVPGQDRPWTCVTDENNMPSKLFQKK